MGELLASMSAMMTELRSARAWTGHVGEAMGPPWDWSKASVKGSQRAESSGRAWGLRWEGKMVVHSEWTTVHQWDSQWEPQTALMMVVPTALGLVVVRWPGKEPVTVLPLGLVWVPVSGTG